MRTLSKCVFAMTVAAIVAASNQADAGQLDGFWTGSHRVNGVLTEVPSNGIKEVYRYEMRGFLFKSTGTLEYDTVTQQIRVIDDKWGAFQGFLTGPDSARIFINRWIGLLPPHDVTAHRK